MLIVQSTIREPMHKKAEHNSCSVSYALRPLRPNQDLSQMHGIIKIARNNFSKTEENLKWAWSHNCVSNTRITKCSLSSLVIQEPQSVRGMENGFAEQIV
jgi:hypothetical protein